MTKIYFDPQSSSSTPGGTGGASSVASPGDTSGGNVPPAQTGGGSAGVPFTPPAGQRLVADADYSRFEQADRSYRELGFKDPTEAQALKPLLDVIRQQKRDPAMLAQLLAQPKPEKGESKQPEFDPSKMKQEIMDDMDRKSRWDSHNKTFAELPKKLQSDAKEWLGTEDKEICDLLWKSAMHDIEQARWAAYGKDATAQAKGYPAELNPDQLAEVLKPYADIGKTIRGKNLASIGAAANKARTTTVAGSQGGHGKSAPTKEDGTFEEQDRDSKLAAIREVREALSASRR